MVAGGSCPRLSAPSRCCRTSISRSGMIQPGTSSPGGVGTDTPVSAVSGSAVMRATIARGGGFVHLVGGDDGDQQRAGGQGL